MVLLPLLSYPFIFGIIFSCVFWSYGNYFSPFFYHPFSFRRVIWVIYFPILIWHFGALNYILFRLSPNFFVSYRFHSILPVAYLLSTTFRMYFGFLRYAGRKNNQAVSYSNNLSYYENVGKCFSKKLNSHYLHYFFAAVGQR